MNILSIRVMKRSNLFITKNFGKELGWNVSIKARTAGTNCSGDE